MSGFGRFYPPNRDVSLSDTSILSSFLGKNSRLLRLLSMSMNLGPLGAAVLLGFGGFGDSLESVKQTNFFQWFCLEQTGQARDEQGREIIEFRPSGEKFRQFVSLKVTRQSGGQMVAMDLTLDRDFINSSGDGVFAADIAKSFILSAVSSEAKDQVKGLADEIEFGSYRRSGRPVLLHSEHRSAAIPGQPSPGYATYLDSQPQWRLALPGVELSLQNENLNGRSVLRIRISK